MKIFGNPMSTCTRRVTMALTEKQAKFDFVTLDFAKGEHKQPDNLARQPFGQIPSLTDGDFTLFESRAMIRYIDDAVPGQALSPKAPRERALMEQWISVEMEHYNPCVSGIVFEEVFKKMFGGTTDAARVEDLTKKLGPVMAVLDKHLAKGPHFVGDQFTLADICFMPYTEYSMNTSVKDLLLSHGNFAAWWKRTSERAAWKHVTGK